MKALYKLSTCTLNSVATVKSLFSVRLIFALIHKMTTWQIQNLNHKKTVVRELFYRLKIDLAKIKTPKNNLKTYLGDKKCPQK